ncbi:MAG: DUF1326 domain-containing protein [Blastocatellia bacterium]|nr:DUF1326 domain-containing protein [Blastocatellia bacterium]
MRKLTSVLSVCGTLLLLAAIAQAQQIRGEYIESRNADVYTGHCFAMSEINLVGDQAILAWRVSKGEWNGVNLDGLGVVGIVKSELTLGDPYAAVNPAKTVLIVDEKATTAQRAALASMARELSNGLVTDIVRTETAPISFEIEFHGEHPSGGAMTAGSLASVVARAITEKDRICGHEQTYYAPLAATAHAMPVVASLDQFNGKGLGVNWTLREKRSAFVGYFVR